MRIRCILYIMLGAFLLAACSGIDYEQQLERFEEMNRTGVCLSSDSVLPLVRHYDHWWHSRNIRMRAYYMLGCAYRDMGEAPAALHFYNIAVEKADTTSKKCDYATLFHVYGQMAMIYGQQNLPSNELKAWKNYSRYAWLVGDTLNWIMGYAYSADPYYRMDSIGQVIKNSNEAYHLYNTHGYKKQAARVYSTAIYACIEKNLYTRARQYMEKFEHDSGLFDKDGNIETGRELYYDAKGKYYSGINELDSAEHFFRILPLDKYSLQAYQGLLNIYQKKNDADSIVKYSRLHEQALLQWQGTQQSAAIIQSSALYDYTRIQRHAEQEDKDSQISHLIIIILFSILLTISLLIYNVYNRHMKNQLEQELKYHRLVEEHTKIKENLIQQKEMLNSFRNKITEKEEKLKDENIFKTLLDIANNPESRKRPTQKEWNQFVSKYRNYMPHMFARMKVARLTKRELYAAMLTHLDFQANKLLILLDTTSSIISNTKASANMKIFADKSATTLQKNLKKCAYLE